MRPPGKPVAARAPCGMSSSAMLPAAAGASAASRAPRMLRVCRYLARPTGESAASTRHLPRSRAGWPGAAGHPGKPLPGLRAGHPTHPGHSDPSPGRCRTCLAVTQRVGGGCVVTRSLAPRDLAGRPGSTGWNGLLPEPSRRGNSGGMGTCTSWPTSPTSRRNGDDTESAPGDDYGCPAYRSRAMSIRSPWAPTARSCCRITT